MIRDIKEIEFPVLGGGEKMATLHQATVTLEDMGEKTITAQVKIAGDIVPDFSRDWVVEFKGEKYIMPLRQPQGAKENTSLNATVDLTFQHWAIYQLKRWYFFTLPPVNSGTAVPDKYIASVSLNLKDFCELISQVLSYYYGESITLDLNPKWQSTAEPTTVEISYSYIWDVLIQLYDLYGVRWVIEPQGDSGHYVIRVGYPTNEINHIFQYGFDGGLLKVERQVQDENIRNMILGRGGEKNLPYRYYKKHDDNNKSYSPDPDWIPELENIYFSELRGATFRSYIQGWKTAHYGGASVGSPGAAYAPWAWLRGAADKAFNPVEFVADEFSTTNSGYGVADGSSIARYGELMGGLDNNEDIYPTIQGVEIAGLGRIDETVAIEPILSDDVEAATTGDAQLMDVPEAKGGVSGIYPAESKKVVLAGGTFVVPAGMTANFDEGVLTINYSTYTEKEVIDWSSGGYGKPPEVQVVINEGEMLPNDGTIEVLEKTVKIINTSTRFTQTASGIPAGKWMYEITVVVKNNDASRRMSAKIACASPKVLWSESTENNWGNTWDIWIKNIWQSERLTGETDAAYAERVWRPILGDRTGSEAKVVFSDGWLSTSEDYEFTIVDIPKFDDTMSIPVKDSNGNETGKSYPSHWRITLAKSDADLEATGLYLPSTRRQAEAGDHIFFIGIDMPHLYVVEAEKRLDSWKKDELAKVKDIKPTWVVGLDKVRIHNYGEAGALVDQLHAGDTFTLFDQRFISGSAQEKLYIKSITYTYNEPTETEAKLLPDVEIVLSEKYETSANPVTQLSGEVTALQKQVGSISNVEQIVRAVGDKLYLRKDGMPDKSMSPTEYASLLTSLGFRPGIVGGRGWGFFKDESGKWVLEADRINVREEMQVNNLVINQITARGGMIIESAASLELSRVVNDGTVYVCYFDQKGGSIQNLFQVGDIAYCQRYTGGNVPVKYYKRRVTAVDEQSVTLSNIAAWVDGSGSPAEGDVIVHWGSYTNPERRFVKVRDVIGGGYERYLEGLDSVTSQGEEYYFVGRMTGNYDSRPRFYIGDPEGYIEWRNGVLHVKGEISAESNIGGLSLPDYVGGVAGSMRNLLPGSESIIVEAGSGNYQNVMVTLPFPVKKGDVFTVNIVGGIDLLFPENLSGLQQFSVRIYGASNNNAIDGMSGGATLSNAKTSATFVISEDSDVARVTFYPGVWGQASGRSARFNKVMFVRGATVPDEWMPSLYDPDYLLKALKESTVINGGLILSTLIKLGYTSDEGYKVMAGMNGVYSSDARGGGLAFWAGGDAIDKADNQEKGAAFGVRHDGSAYAANNTVRFGKNVVEVGDSVILTDDGLFLLDEEGNERLQVSNATVEDGLADISDVQRTLTEGTELFAQLSTYDMQVLPSPGGGSAEITTETVLVPSKSITWTMQPASLYLPPNASIKINTLKLSLSTRPAGLTQRRFIGLTVVRVGYFEGTSKVHWRGPYQEDFTSAGGYEWSVEFDLPAMKTTASTRQYFIEVTLYKWSQNASSRTYNTTMSGEAKGSIEISFDSKTVLGSDGLLSIWGKAGFLATKKGVVMRCGNYILRVTGAGIQYSRQGGQDGSWNSL